jgi:hypothetical protein
MTTLRTWFLLLFAAVPARAGTGYWLPKPVSRYVPPCLTDVARPDLGPSGVFRCAALPARVTFPAGYDLRAVEDANGPSATVLTVSPGGAVVFHYTVTTWRPEDPDLTQQIDREQERMLAQLTIVDGVKILGRADVSLPGLGPGRAVTFTDRQRQVRGEMRSFIVTGFGLSLIAFGSGDHELAPDGSIARAFFASLRRAEVAPPPPLEVTPAVRLALPPGAYALSSPPMGSVRSWMYLVPGALAHLAVLDAGAQATCLQGLTQARDRALLQQVIGGGKLGVTVDEVQVVDERTNRWRGTIRSSVGPGALSTVGLIHCAPDTHLLMIQANGETPQTTLTTLLEPALATLAR